MSYETNCSICGLADGTWRRCVTKGCPNPGAVDSPADPGTGFMAHIGLMSRRERWHLLGLLFVISSLAALCVGGLIGLAYTALQAMRMLP